jgi:hypothetical protein
VVSTFDKIEGKKQETKESKNKLIWGRWNQATTDGRGRGGEENENENVVGENFNCGPIN